MGIRKTTLLISSVMILSLFSAATLWAADLRVPDDYNTIQAAVDAASNGDNIILKPGQYTGPGNCDIDFKGKLITVRSEMPDDWNIVESTVIDCQGTDSDLHRAFIFRNGEDPNAVVDGLTITNGVAFEGGAILCQGGSPAIRNCLFKNNTAHNSNGGAIACFYTDNVLISNCIFRENLSSHTGGAICCNDNKHLKIINCLLQDNTAESKGGGIYCRDNRSIYVINCTIIENKAEFAGGIYGIGDLGTSAAIVNTIIWNNQYPGLGGGHAWNELQVSYCVLQEFFGGKGNIETDPQLNSEGHISSSSSVCVDAGIITKLQTETDIDQEDRIVGDQIDIGCDELR